jgi:hypothetical protein
MSSCRSNRREWKCVRARKTFHILIAGMAVLLLCLPAFSQLNSGSIAGGITDQTGAVIAGTKVTIIDLERGVSRPLVTDSAGQYTAPSLTPGQYTVRAEATGFRTVERTNIAVGVGQAVRVDLQLLPGEQTQTVTVTGEAPLIDTSNEVISNTVDTLTLNELPISGRLYTKVLDFQPGIIGRRAGIHRTTHPTAPVSRAIIGCWTAWRTSMYLSTLDP